MTIRLAHLVSHPIQYFAPLYRELACRPEVDLTVFFYSDRSARAYTDPGFGRLVEWDVPMLEGYRSVFCDSASRTPIDGSPLRRRNFDVVLQVVRGRYDAVWVHGYAHATAWLAFAGTRATRTPFLLREEQTLTHPRSLTRRAVKSLPLKTMCRSAYGLYIGAENRRYLERWGIPPERLFCAPYGVDNARLRAAASALAPERERLRAAWRIPAESCVVLFVGKLVESKHPQFLIDALDHVKENVHVLVVGDGPDAQSLRSRAVERRPGRVTFVGFLNQTELPHAYVAADVFALPSPRETWGLVVNEAMNFDLPVIVTEGVGCAADLVEPDRNGYVVAPGDAHALARAIDALARNAGRRAAFGRRSREIVDAYGIDRTADGIVAGVKAAVSESRRRR